MKLIVLLLLIAAPVAAQAPSRWRPLGRTAVVSISVDTTRLLYSGGEWTAWIEWNYAKPKLDKIGGKEVAYVRTLVKTGLDCEQQRIRQYATYAYARDGSVVTSFEPNELSEWQDPIPESVGEGMLRSFCELAKQRRARPSDVRDSVPAELPRSTTDSYTQTDRSAIEAACSTYAALASVDTSKPAICGHFKSGH